MDLFMFMSVIGVFISGSVGFDDQTYRCPKSVKVTRYVKTFGDYCFEFVPRERSWYGAHDECRSRHGHLVVIRDRNTQNFVVRTLRSFHWPRNGIWLGATDRENEMSWKWVSGHRVRYGYSNWASGQPSCHILCFEDCAQMRLDDGGRWHDYKCDWIEDYSYICQYPLLPKTTTTSTTTTTTTTTTPTTTTRERTTTTMTMTTSPPVLNSTVNETGLLNIEVGVERVEVLENSRMSKLEHGSNSGHDTVSIVGLVLGLLLGVLLGLCLGVFFFRRRHRKEKEEAPNVYFHNPFYADLRAPLTSSPSVDEGRIGCCPGGLSVSQAPTPVKRPVRAPPVPKKDYDIPLPIRDSTDESQIDDITAQKLLYAAKCGKANQVEGAVGGGELYERYVEPRYVESPEDDEGLVDQHFDQTTGENYYESMENVRLAIRQNALNEQQEERYIPFQFDADELGYQKQ
ncbi:uncharacterized protein LOC143287566 [Babylonia areolata]|uniref:uncharacterized protein LOC143287566 n=1 Tax=Babylonia areolata TaxID=304850 RepID=UPI003FD3DCE7